MVDVWESDALSFEIKGVSFSSPIILASGTAGYGYELEGILDFSKIGAVVTKGISPKPRDGNPSPRIAEFSVKGFQIALLNSIGLQNPGARAFAKDHMPKLKKIPTKIIANVFGEKERDYPHVIKVLENSENPPDAYELNLSCPNTQKGGIEFGVNPKSVQRIVRLCRKSTSRPILVKFSPFSEILPQLVRISLSEGADAFTISNTLPSALWDKKYGFFKGGMSGYPLKPVVLRCVIELCERFEDIKIIGCGGIYNFDDAMEYFLAGATAVQIGTATFLNPKTAEEIYDNLLSELKKSGKTLREIIGSGLKITAYQRN